MVVRKITLGNPEKNHPDVASQVMQYKVPDGQTIHIDHKTLLYIELHKTPKPKFPLVPGLIEVFVGNGRRQLVLSESIARAIVWRARNTTEISKTYIGRDFAWLPLRFGQFPDLIAEPNDRISVVVYAPHVLVPEVSRVELEADIHDREAA